MKSKKLAEEKIKQEECMNMVIKELKEKGMLRSDGLYDFEGDVNMQHKGVTKLPKNFFGNVGGNFSCGYSSLTSLAGSPQTVGGNFSCGCGNLTRLKGGPQTVRGGFYCNNNKLTSLEGLPQTVGGDFCCNGNNLTSLDGCPQNVKKDFSCYDNKLTNLEGAPESVGGHFECWGNKRKFTAKEVRKVCAVGGKVYAAYFPVSSGMKKFIRSLKVIKHP